ncbi:MAG: glycosyltransferase family 2 protein [Alphaproteobacteria bacterium]|nr:glycosyltransferase family 2 protein [Alphaproteobacteria bacterium]
MKVFVQIPCYNEADSIAQTIADIPKEIAGVSEVSVVVIDDGSTDNTAEIALKNGADHVVHHHMNLGLATAFKSGLDYCLEQGADIILNTDGDGQYRGKYIPALLAPLLEDKAEVVIGNRQVHEKESYTSFHRRFHRLGSRFINCLLGVDVDDPISGFRAIRANVARRLNIHSSFSYTTEMLVQLRYLKIHIMNIPVTTNSTTRPSRLYKKPMGFVVLTGLTVLRAYAMYFPLRALLPIAGLCFLIGTIPIVRFLIAYGAGEGMGHIQSLILAAMAIILGTIITLFAMLFDFQLRQKWRNGA